jgi:cytochrome c oxidase assembly factor CtaG
MNSIVFNRRHLKEYLLFGSAGAALYMTSVVFFLSHNSYQHLYYLFMGCLFFMVAIFFYEYKLLYSRYDEKRAVSMLLAGLFTTLTGVLMACIFAVVAMFFSVLIYFPLCLSNNYYPTQQRRIKPVSPFICWR